jgi:hypothetical protein
MYRVPLWAARMLVAGRNIFTYYHYGLLRFEESITLAFQMCGSNVRFTAVCIINVIF